MSMTADEREDAKLTLDQDQYELDKRRVVLEEAKSRTDNLFFNRKFPALVTAIASVAAGLFSYVQWHVASVDKDREVQVASLNKERELLVVQQKNDQEFKLAVARFVTEHSKDIFEGTDDQRQRIRNVIEASFPRDVSNAIFAKLEQSAPSLQAASIWSEGQKVPAAASGAKPEVVEPRVYLQYQDKADAALMDSLMSYLRANGYRVPGRQLVTQDTKGDVRYYHEGNDKDTAEKIAKLVGGFLSDNHRTLTLKTIPVGKRYPNMPEGVFEVWLPKKNPDKPHASGPAA